MSDGIRDHVSTVALARLAVLHHQVRELVDVTYALPLNPDNLPEVFRAQ